MSGAVLLRKRRRRPTFAATWGVDPANGGLGPARIGGVRCVTDERCQALPTTPGERGPGNAGQGRAVWECWAVPSLSNSAQEG
jgi:hypothetical protein